MNYGKETQVTLITLIICFLVLVALTFTFNKFRLKEEPSKETNQPSLEKQSSEYNSKLLELIYAADEFNIKQRLEGNTDEVKQIYVQLVMKHKELQKLAELYNIMVESDKEKIVVPTLSSIQYSGKDDLIK